ncbi:unnamed protein product [Aureobasidium mustum]|uniref:V-type proton ATPase subunit G n=1 Tax=Aureobasidium mustum TaxID=2773714 RepID=A0A9N8JE67_9PEZI|nr:unnamed protein product [Aureobasidium mustum]
MVFLPEYLLLELAKSHTNTCSSLHKTRLVSKRCSTLSARPRRSSSKVGSVIESMFCIHTNRFTAREYRTKRVKDARSEAQKEIDEYRNKKEEEFKQFSTQHTSGNEQAEKDASKDTDEKLKEIKSIGDKEGSTVVENLLRAVTDVKPQVPDRVEQPVA